MITHGVVLARERVPLRRLLHRFAFEVEPSGHDCVRPVAPGVVCGNVDGDTFA